MDSFQIITPEEPSHTVLAYFFFLEGAKVTVHKHGQDQISKLLWYMTDIRVAVSDYLQYVWSCL